MTDYFYDSYLSPLDALAFDIVQSPSEIDQETAAADLALWSNAQFKFDEQPGRAIFDEEKTTVQKPAQVTDPITYENLVNYLDYELPQQAKSPQQQVKADPLPGRQLLPKPTLMDPLQLASFLTSPLVAPSVLPSSPPLPLPLVKQQHQQPRKKPAVVGIKREHEETALADEDKRKRNTAASARFRIKKKQREQAMEQTVRDMTKKSDFLQGRVNDLELEVKWLRSLLTEKELTVKN